jgi:hypothetical protein
MGPRSAPSLHANGQNKKNVVRVAQTSELLFYLLAKAGPPKARAFKRVGRIWSGLRLNVVRIWNS